MSRYVSYAALALAMLACALIIYEKSSREAAIRRALQQREAAMVQRYAPMIQRMIEELDSGERSVTIWNMDEGLQSLANAVERLSEQRRREQATLPASDAPLQERFSAEPTADVVSPSFTRIGSTKAQRSSGAALAANPNAQRRSHERARVAPVEPSLIAVALTAAGDSNIALIDTNGNVVERLTNGPNVDQLPTWSADGRRLSFVSNRENGNELFVMDWQGNDLHQVTHVGETVRMSAWSPDGRRILFTTQQNTGIYVVDADGRDEARVLVRNGSMPAWSPDGKQIAFNMGSQIWIADSDGRLSRPLFQGDTPHSHVQAFFYPRWSPNGKQILFTSLEARRLRRPEDVQLDVYVTGLHDPNPVVIGPSEGVDIALDWSPDGRQILFFSDRNSDAGLYVMDAEGSGVRRVIKSESLFGNWGAWRPSSTVRLASNRAN